MGSSGTGRFSDYSGKKPKSGGDTTGGSSGKDKCGKAFSANLEDIELLQYWKNHGEVPAKGEKLIIVAGKRISASTAKGEIVGNLPTTFNYIKYCMDDGFEYSGIITSSISKPMAAILADFAPNK